MQRYLKCKKARYRKAMKETNDCSVIATAIVARITYKAAHTLLTEHYRKPRHGSYNGDTRMAIKSQGFSVEEVKTNRQKNGSKFTPKTIGDKLKRGYYLCFCHRHVFAVVNGTVEDWTQNRNHHITEIYKIIRKK